MQTLSKTWNCFHQEIKFSGNSSIRVFFFQIYPENFNKFVTSAIISILLIIEIKVIWIVLKLWKERQFSSNSFLISTFSGTPLSLSLY